MQRQRRNSFILVEVIVGTILFAGLLAVMFGIFWRCSKINEIISQKRKQHEQILIVQGRLQDIFNNSMFHKATLRKSYFFIEDAKMQGGQSLVFTYAHSGEAQEPFVSQLGAKIYVDDEKKLCLAAWPYTKKIYNLPETVRKEILLDNVDSLEIELFAGSEVDREKRSSSRKEKAPADKIEECKWLSVWPKEAERRPVLVRLTCHRNSSQLPPLYFTFFIPKQIYMILYNRG